MATKKSYKVAPGRVMRSRVSGKTRIHEAGDDIKLTDAEAQFHLGRGNVLGKEAAAPAPLSAPEGEPEGDDDPDGADGGETGGQGDPGAEGELEE